ncbi:MAG TPA: tetratricopeptide repeat protein, partial [Candidatus Sulfotelmatobacter sp.]|nr:tetratricopeptide repeat protein [Candidatus Sulfotelmatobacter sp.]
ARAQNHQFNLATALNNVGTVAMGQGDYGRARPLLEEAVSLLLGLGQRDLAAIACFNLGLLALSSGELPYARERLNEALRMHREGNDLRGVSAALGKLSQVAYHQEAWNEAWEHVNEVELLSHEVRDNCVHSMSLYTKGRLLIRERDLDRAETTLRQCFDLLSELGERVWLWDPLVALAEVFVLRNRPQQAARLLGAAEAIREGVGGRVCKVDQPWYDRIVQAVRRSSGGVNAAWMVGRLRYRGELAEILGDERQPGGDVSRPAPVPTPARGPGAEALTPREREIVQLIVAGCTIKEVSQRLHLSPRTVQKHEENIRTKLGLVNRASVAAWAVRQGVARE